MIISVRTQDFREAGDALVDVGARLETSLNELVSSLSGTGGMAGSDPQARQWADSYDVAAQKAANAVGTFGSILKTIGVLLHQSGYNRLAAVSHSTLGGRAPLPPAVAYVNLTPAPPVSLPTSFGGGAPTPPGWNLVEYAVGYVWPDGHQDLLLFTGAAWHTLAGAINDVAQSSSASLSSLIGANRAPEIELIRVTSARLRHDLSGIADFCAKLGDMSDKFASQLDAAHQRIESELKSLLASIVVSQVVGIGTAAATAGMSEGVATAADAGIIATTAARIASIIGDLVDFVDTIVSAVGDVLEGALSAFGDFVGGILDVVPDLADFSDVADFSSVGVDSVVDTADSVGLGSLDASGVDAVDGGMTAAADGGESASLAGDASASTDGVDSSLSESSTATESSSAGSTPTRAEKIIRGVTSNVAGTVAGDEAGGHRISWADIGIAAFIGGGTGFVGDVIAPDAEGFGNLEKNVAIGAVGGGTQETLTELADTHQLNVDEILTATGTGAVSGATDTATDHFTDSNAEPDVQSLHNEASVRLESEPVSDPHATSTAPSTAPDSQP